MDEFARKKRAKERTEEKTTSIPSKSALRAAMVLSSRAADSSRSKKSDGEQGKEGTANLSWKLSQLKKQIQASRLASIREKIEKNRKSLQVHTCQLFDVAAAAEAATRSSSRKSQGENLLSVRVGSAPCRLGGWDWLSGVGEKEIIHYQEEVPLSGTTTLVIGSSSSNKTAVRLVVLPFVEKIPPYTTWIFLNKNQRMAEDQSVVGRRRIYYDSYGSEALICSDTDEEIVEPEEEKHEFSEGEDQIILKVLREHGINQEVLSILCQFVDATPDEIEERYEILVTRDHKNVNDFKSFDEEEYAGNQFLDKTLNTALDSFDYLFCRRCLIFDCRLHGCSQNLIIPSEKQSSGSELEDNRRPCGGQCYFKGRDDIQDQDHNKACDDSMHEMQSKPLTKELDKSLPLESEDSNPDDENANPTISDGTCIKGSGAISSETRSRTQNVGATSSAHITPEDSMTNVGKRKISEDEKLQNQDLSDKSYSGYADKKQKKLTSLDVSPASENLLHRDSVFVTNTECPDFGAASPNQLQKECVDESIECLSRTDLSAGKGSRTIEGASATKDVFEGPRMKNSSGATKEQTVSRWNTIEKDLYLKGVEMFGKNSCLIARNLLFGLKTCIEVANYMFNDGASTVSRPLSSFYLDDSGKEDQEYMEQEMPTRSRLLRRRGKTRKLKYTWKSAGHPSIRKRISNGKQQSCKLYTPCGCHQMCGKECPCMINGTCCEKYCGCSKSCKNRFRGCHCAKSQCRSRQCPCFAAGRECDPDVCRNCWVSCGDGSTGEPPARGDGYQCGNMNLLLKQQKRILLARSDVAGWGAFIKNPVNKNDYLGEYTGELISHKEADKRGKIYDRANSSFLFDLNDQYVLDAYRKGDKLKFANHSSNPNCYAKVMLVAGDHRVGIFAKEHIEASEELFYDYRYGPDQAPAWARRPEGSKRDDSTASHSRAHKVA